MLSSTFIFPWVLLWANVYDGFWECNTMAIEKQTESGNKTKVTCIRTATLKRYFTQKWKYCHHFLIIPILTILLHNTKHDILKNVSISHWSPTRGGWYGKISYNDFFSGKKYHVNHVGFTVLQVVWTVQPNLFSYFTNKALQGYKIENRKEWQRFRPFCHCFIFVIKK